MTRHLAIVGPTATGKSALALAVAAACDGVEIVSLDAMQVYREMDIGTAKPTAAERATVPHHLIDVADPSEEWSVRATQHAAARAIVEIEARGGRALLVGGTGLYVRAVVDALAVPGTDPDVRAAIERTYTTDSAFARLQQLDPIAAARIEPGNRRRIVRALEVVELTGRPFSSFGPGLTEYGPPAVDVTLIGLTLAPETLATRIADRFATMRAAGIVDEVHALAGRPGGLGRTARQAIGYKEVLAYLDGGIGSLEEALDLAVRRTRQFARRQRVWFRRDPRIAWLDAEQKSGPLLAEVLARWNTTVPAEVAPRS